MYTAKRSNETILATAKEGISSLLERSFKNKANNSNSCNGSAYEEGGGYMRQCKPFVSTHYHGLTEFGHVIFCR